MRSPFKFLDAYSLEDKDQFFGRETEIEELYQMVFKTPLLLVYGLSGTGKTSLIQCGLASRFEGPDWLPLFIRRQENINGSMEEAVKKALPEPWPGSIPAAIRQLYRHFLRPVYLIFDQFEELFILGSREEQQQFMITVRSILDNDLPCTMLLVMREEYIGRLYHFEKNVPALFDFRLRVEPMNTGKVREVLQASFDRFNITLSPSGEAVLPVMIDNISAGKSGIQLPYLQVYLDMLYREDYQRTYGDQERGETLQPLTFTVEEVEAFGAIENVLEKFLHQQEVELQQHLKNRYPDFPNEAVRSVLDLFVSEEGTKRPIGYQLDPATKQILLEEKAREPVSVIETGALSDCLNLLEQSRLLRFSTEQIELAHDSLATLIDEQRSDEQRQLNEVKRRILNTYFEYQQTSEFLSRKQINAFEDYLPMIPLEPAVRQFLDDSRAHAERQDAEQKARQQRELDLVNQKLEAERRAARRQRFFTAFIGIAAIASIGFGLLAQYRRQQAEEARQKLRTETFNNLINRAEALKLQGIYDQAIEQLNLSWITDTAMLQKDQLQLIDSLQERYQRIQSLVVLADSLVQDIPTLPDALVLYREAYQIDPDPLISRRITQTEIDIRREFENLKSRAFGIIEYAGCTSTALDYLELAAKLDPEDKEVRSKMEGCKRRK